MVESYPAEFYAHFDLPLGNKYGGKRSITARARCAPLLIKWANEFEIKIDQELELRMSEGFTSESFEDDGFDACIGVFGMLNVILGKKLPSIPESKYIQKIEGWIFGQSFLQP